jgi:hypothetical protein
MPRTAAGFAVVSAHVRTAKAAAAREKSQESKASSQLETLCLIFARDVRVSSRPARAAASYCYCNPCKNKHLRIPPRRLSCPTGQPYLAAELPSPTWDRKACLRRVFRIALPSARRVSLGTIRTGSAFAGMDSPPALEQQKWQTYFTTCCVWTTSRAFSPFSLPSSSAGNCGRVGSWLPLTALSSASSAYAPRNSASFPRISSASLSTRATLSPGASARRTMPPNRTPRLLP